MQNVFTQTIHVPGTLGANLGIYYKLPMDVQLVHVSANGSNTNNGLLTIGYTGALAAYLASSSIGLGYRYGRTPEIFSVASPTAGLMFTNDTLPIKVRFFFACGPTDWRGLYKANVA